ncbi:hypothetical protein PMAYCL1PPCAC_09269, partial [Pristionchus mayeri]
YFYCVFYRRSVVFPPGSRFCYVGFRRFTLFATIQISLLALTSCIFVILESTRTPAEEIPDFLGWVRTTESFIIVRLNMHFWIAGSCTFR